MARIRLVGRARGGRCVFCHDGLDGELDRCPECRAAWHQDCRPQDGHCHTLGCTAPAPLPARHARAARAATRERPPPVPPAWTTRRRRPGWLARFGPYSRLFVSGLLHAAVTLTLLFLVIVGVGTPPSLLLKGGADGPTGLIVAFLMNGACLLAALTGIAWSGSWLRRLPGVVAELHELLERTDPVLMELSIETVESGESTTHHACLQGRHGLYADQRHRFRIGGLLPPGWLVRRARRREVVLVYGLPPPGPYVLEFESGALALLHPD